MSIATTFIFSAKTCWDYSNDKYLQLDWYPQICHVHMPSNIPSFSILDRFKILIKTDTVYWYWIFDVACQMNSIWHGVLNLDTSYRIIHFDIFIVCGLTYDNHFPEQSVITHRYPDYIDSFTKQSLKWVQSRVTTFHSFMRVWFLFNSSPQLIEFQLSTAAEIR